MSNFRNVLFGVRVRSDFGFGFIFGRKHNLTFAGHSALAESHTPLFVLLSVLAKSEIFTFLSGNYIGGSDDSFVAVT